jgi:LuxR family maltose regulon positive regulatory protein
LRPTRKGWVAGLQLAGLSLQGHPDPAGFGAAFSGSHRYVLDYLAEEVLARQPEHLVRFLLETSVLDRLSGPLCEAVTGRSDSQRLLEQVERANLFLIPLDGQRRWWRFHHLFADLLRARVQQADPERVPELHRGAAAWCEAHGLADEAVRHALAAGDPHWAARLIERHLEEQILRRSEGATLARWLAALPAEVVRSRPRLCLGQATTDLLGGRTDQAEPLIRDAERALADAGGPSTGPPGGPVATLVANVPASIALTRAELARQRGDAERVVAFSRQALAHLTEDERADRHRVDWYLAMADWFRGRLAQAERALAVLVAEQRAAGEGYGAVRPAYDLGEVQRARGRLGAALATFDRRWSSPPRPGRPLCACRRRPPMPELDLEARPERAATPRRPGPVPDRRPAGARLGRRRRGPRPLLPGAWVRLAARRRAGRACWSPTPG